MLAGHPQLFAPPELQLLNFQTLRDRRRVLANGRDDFWLQGTVRALMALHGIDADRAADHMARCERADLTVQQFYRYLQAGLGDRVLVDKTPTYALDPATLRRAEEDFERPRYIHLVREAGAAVESFLEAKLHVFFPPFFTAPPGLAPRALAEAIWAFSHENITEFLSGMDAARVHRVFFDDLVREPVAVMARLSRFLEIPFLPATANPYTHDSRTLMTNPVQPLARMLGDVKFQQHGRVRSERAGRGGDRPGGVPLGAPTRRIQARLTAHLIQRPSSLTTLRAEGGGEPLVLVHPAGGGVACYRHLVARLRPGPQVLAHRGVAMEGTPYESLVELAATYVRDLRERQAHGPYRLCGWSFGGIVAFEMAAQLVTAGEPVAFLSLLDARLHVPGARSLFAADDDLLGAFLRDYEIDHIGEPSPDRPARALAEGKQRGILPPWLSLDDLVEMAARYGAAFQHNIGLARTYTPSARVPRLLVVEAADRRGLPAAAASWAPWADVVEHTEVPGDHFSVLRPPQVDAGASIVAAHLGSPRTSVPAVHR
jgi:thioesterase domain-containing protein